ncbi:MAG: hypothetical protein LQ348_002135 [Seirophora lacunosa]|nr:MAG: hypothetical protein LQ348_002135 [Seirophora lacunosa]
MSLASCPAVDDTFGPYASHCRGGFDFTLLFEESILSILPICCILSLVPFRVAYLLRRTIKVNRTYLLPSKLVLYALLAIFQVALVALWAGPSATRTRASIPNAAVTFVGTLALGVLSYAEHQRTIRPSLLLEAYLLLSLIFDAARVRTLWLQDYNNIIAAITTAALAIKICLLALETRGKERFLHIKYTSQSPEAKSGLFGKSLFLWLNRLFRTGYRQSLSVEDLLPLDKHLTSDYLYRRLHQPWADKVEKGPRSLLMLFFSQLKWSLLAVVPPRLGLIGFTFCQPFLIERAVELTRQPVDGSSTNVGYGLIGAYFLVYVGIAITTGQYQHLTYRAITMARGGLVSMMFAKTPLVKANAADPASSLTLMSADIERITHGWQTMHECWANVVEVAVAIWLLERQLGAACAIPIGVAVVSFAGSIFVTNLVVQRQARWLEAIERRISATATMLGSMKRVKMCGLTDTLFDNLHGLRIEELKISKKFRRLLIGSIFFAFTTPIIAPVLTFTVFALVSMRDGGDTTMDTTKVFTSLSLFALLADPLASLIMAMLAFAGSLGSFDRIQEFLVMGEHVDKRIKSHPDFDSVNASSTGESSAGSIAWTEKSISTTASERPLLPFTRPGGGGHAVSVDAGSFGYQADKDALLSAIQARIPRGKFTMVVGPVGCGKTTLLKALLGEVPALEGSIKYLGTDVAYCDQSPFHMNGTVRDSITAFSEMDDRWYSTVVKACALTEDLRQMQLGDCTRIGSKGVALSGGQSQRVALARAAYARHDICMLDDVLSGLDMDTENQVFHNLLGLDGLFRRQATTVILTSSSSSRLPFADHIIVLNDKGQIAEQGSFSELNLGGGHVSSLDLEPADWRVREQGTSKLDQLLQNAPQDYIPTLAPTKEAVDDPDSEFESNKRTGDLSVYAFYAKSVGRTSVLIFMLAISAYVFCVSFPQIWLGWWAAANAREPNQRLGYWLGIYAVLGVAGLFSVVVSCWQIVITMVPQSGESFHWRLLNTVLSAPMSFFATTDTGVTLNRFSQDLQLIDMDLPLSALNFFTALMLCVAQIILIGVSSVYAAASFPVWIIAVYFIQKYYLRTSRQLRFLDLEAKSPLYCQFTEIMAGLTTVRAFGWQHALEKKNRYLLDQSQRPFYLLFAVQRWLQLVLDLLVAAVAVMLIILVVELHGFLSAEYVGIALLNVILFGQHLKLVLQYWTLLETHIGAVSRVRNFSSTVAVENGPSEDGSPPKDWPASGAIEFRNVHASYDDARNVLKNLTLSIRAGEKVGVCGRTGSGKSSLIMALFRMIELKAGSITIDGVDIATIPRKEVRSRIIGLPQDVFLLNGSVRLNIDPYAQATDQAIINALQDVRLWSNIAEKGGLDAQVDAINLSHGQKQLFCVAQALLRPSSILILDEATSSVDETTDALIQRIIRQKFARHTIIAVAHKLETIIDFDKVAVLHNGELCEFDGPHALLAREDSRFRQLYRGGKGRFSREE